MSNGKDKGAARQGGGGVQQVQTGIMVNVHGFLFNPMILAALDFTRYEPGKPGRSVVIHLVGPLSKTLSDSGADAAYKWYVEVAGASPLPSGLLAPQSLLGRAPGA